VRSVLAAVLLPVVAVLVIGPYTFLPSILEYAVARDVQSRLGLEKRPEVKLQSDPPLEMLSGKFTGGDILLKDAGLGGVRTENAVIDLDPFDVDVLESLSKGSVVASEPLSGGLRVEVPEAEVARLVGESTDVPAKGVTVEATGMEIRSDATFFGTSFPVSATGDLRLAGERFVFEPRDLEAAGMAVPQRLADVVLEGSRFDYPIKGLPYDSRITGVDTAEGKLVLTGRVPRIPLGVYPGG
jgi:LmeA-like phospholipid-binding